MEDDTSDLSRPQLYLFGCTLKSDKREFRVDVDDDDTEQQLSLKAVCLGAEAEDNFHTVEVEGLTYDGKTTKVPLAVLKPSVLPSMSLGGFEITPPVTFRLQSGAGPVHISGQHFVSVKESDDEEEENNTSPVKRPASLMSGKKPPMKKLKMDSDDDDEEDSDEDDEDDDEDDDSDDNAAKPQKKVGKMFEKSRESPAKKSNKTPVKQNGPAGKASGSAVRPQTQIPAPGKDKPQAGSSKSLSLAEIKSKLSTTAKEGKSLPKTEQKFENFVKSSYKVTDKSVSKDEFCFVMFSHVRYLHERFT
ncbi:nucleophosmin-like isoform X1 [Solea senegalensis]|uniref:Nucleophosmin n=1 Tax=Solea senegalensis TaxID=28829 RepID=A0AAV6SIV0_SOLSE|nr:nucleophosmin-like isoform X1 [Solea senegalensis]